MDAKLFPHLWWVREATLITEFRGCLLEDDIQFVGEAPFETVKLQLWNCLFKEINWEASADNFNPGFAGS